MYCQQCRTPLAADPSLDGVNPAAFDLLVGSTHRWQQNGTVALSSQQLNYPPERKALYDRASSWNPHPAHHRTIPAPHDATPSRAVNGTGPAHPDMSFIDITHSQVVLPERDAKGSGTAKTAPYDRVDSDATTTPPPLSEQVAKTERLFSVLASYTDIDHPICSECTQILLSSFSARLAAATRERDAYASFLKQAQQFVSSRPQKPSKEPSKEAEKDGIQASWDSLVRMENEKQALEAEIVAFEEEGQERDHREQAFWSGRNALVDELHNSTVTLSSLQEKYTNDQQQLERLQRSNVYNDTFCIGHDGHFGTINGLRLGRLPDQNVDWAEINAAWGQTLLLLATIAERLRYSFQGYRLRPQGSTSRIEKLEYPQQPPETTRQPANPRGISDPKVTQLDLFSGGAALERMLTHRRFDAGMVAFLDCLAQLGTFVERTTRAEPRTNTPRTGLRTSSSKRVLPYVIEGDKIGGISIKLGAGFHPDENFTKACKYALTCCKFLLAHISNLENAKEV